jgi:hypothetical protein
MIGEHVSQGMQVRLRPRGVGRFFAASFLALWLCGWLAGEVVALTILVLGAISVLTGTPIGPMDELPELGAAIVVYAFILIWFAFWTLGGVMAIRELLRSIWAEDRLVAAGHGLIIERRLGPFRSPREISRADLQWIHVLPRAGKLTADTVSGSVELSGLGTPDERFQAATILRDFLGLNLDPGAAGTATLPEEWEETIAPEGYPVLVENPRLRKKMAVFATGLALVVATVGLFLVLEALARPDLVPLAAGSVAAALGLTFGAHWLARARKEWRVGPSTLILCRRYGRRVRELFEGRAVELTVSSDSDNDEWYTLEALPSETAEASTTAGSRKRRRTIDRAIHDPADMQRLGRWLAVRTGLPFTDRSTREVRAADLTRIKVQLSESGRLGRWVLRLIERVEARRASPDETSDRG